jgi:hypothetical protein
LLVVGCWLLVGGWWVGIMHVVGKRPTVKTNNNQQTTFQQSTINNQPTTNNQQQSTN